MSEREMMELILQKVTGMEAGISGLKEDVSGLKENVSGLNERMGVVEQSVSEIKNDVKEVQLTLENVTNANIGIIADGHITLQHQLDETLKSTKNTEMYQIRVNVMEAELRELKRKFQEHLDKAI